MSNDHRLSIGRIIHSRGDPWFEDGNIVLVTHENPTAFRLHRGVLARHSEIFRDMLEFPQPEAKLESHEGCQVVCMYDHPVELSHLVKALYDGPQFQNRNVGDFFYLAGILRLATKYFIANLRAQAVRFLAQIWSYTLVGHDQMVETALQSPSVADLSYPYVHPIHVLNLARETNVSIVIPSAIYFLSLYPLVDILQGDHPKLKVEHPSKPSSILLSADLELYTLMYQYRLTLVLHFVHQFCERYISTPCTPENLCAGRFRRLQLQLIRSWSLRTGPLHYMSQAAQELYRDQNICMMCRSRFQEDVAELRRNTWEGLPQVIGLPSWSEMQATDLSVEPPS
ncbi:hypothetical protein P691DRAFT_716682 [Macrolepiota fuliginosa MF-IS2]|uniref:BTB domain-containing protein n=1 Tax=Macrolepiota fuliginosa MF-IS2 TaxID=1400762 RepID=A0A9P6C7I0_9AGAR|nr:hypothetical protein P691DRAFT_716682 [Macrolepiota fuliginosa MF-IS2]